MRKNVLVVGASSGPVLFGIFVLGSKLAMSKGAAAGWGDIGGLLGFLLMLVTLSVIFVAIKRYRDRELGGVIRFGQALRLGVGISAVAGATYVASWELYLGATDYAFIGEYTQAVVEGKRAEGLKGEELAALTAEMEVMKQRYASPLTRLPMTFLEVFPFGLVISLISAALLRNSRFLSATPAHGPGLSRSVP